MLSTKMTKVGKVVEFQRKQKQNRIFTYREVGARVFTLRLTGKVKTMAVINVY